jgi:hypothetical protein
MGLLGSQGLSGLGESRTSRPIGIVARRAEVVGAGTTGYYFEALVLRQYATWPIPPLTRFAAVTFQR